MPLFPQESVGAYINPATGTSMQLPAAVADALGLQKAASAANPLPEAYDDEESRGMMSAQRPAVAPAPAAPPADIGSNLDFAKRALSLDSVRELAADTRDAVAPAFAPIDMSAAQRALSEKVAPARTDVARIAQATGPIGTVGQIGRPEMAGQPQVRGLPTFTDEEMAAVGQPRAVAPAPRATTEADLKKTGIGGVVDEKQAADADEAIAITHGALAKADQQLKSAEILEGADQRVDKIIADRATEADKMSARIESTTADYRAAVDKYANSKIDRSIDHPIIAAISLAMGAIGSAMKNESRNPALEMLMAQIDRKVQIQLAERDKMKDVAGMKRSDIDLLRQRATDKTAQYNLAISGETEKAARQIEALAARSNSEIVKANGAQLAAQVRQRSAGHLGEGVMATIAREEREKAAAFDREKFAEQQRQAREQEKTARGHLGLGYANLSQRKLEFGQELALKRDQLALEADKLAAAGKGKEAEQLRDHAIGGTTTIEMGADGKPVLGPDGKPVLKQSVVYAPYAGKETLAKLQEQKAAADTIVEMVDESMRLRREFGWGSDLWKSKEWQQLRGNWAALKLELKDLAKLGVIAGPDEKLMNDFLGTGDPTRIQDPLPGMQQARSNVVRKVNNAWRAVGATTRYEPADLSDLKGPVVTPDDVEFKEGIKKPDVLDVASSYVKGDIGTRYDMATGPQGITPDQQKYIRAQVDTMNDETKPADERAKARARLEKGQTSAQTPALRDAYLSAISGPQGGGPITSPEQAGMSVSPVVRSPATTPQADAMKAIDIDRLASAAVKDDLAYKELVRRAEGGKDKAAGSALLDVIKIRSAR